MKNNLRRLKELLKVFNEEDFYNISVTAYEIRLQGYLSRLIISLALAYHFQLSSDDDGVLRFQRGIYKIVLT